MAMLGHSEGKFIGGMDVLEMGRWGDGEMGRWGDGEMGRWGDGEMGRWGDGERTEFDDFDSWIGQHQVKGSTV
ncbi:MAG: hypothetical protein EAZ09_06185 [Oscillatoriales cyanobacterium]|nr:MAG: hypothetical protein EAZ09_06185 [Oscillatoriales cyanobacterium]